MLIAKAKIPPLIVTLGSLGMALGFAQIITHGVDIRQMPLVLQSEIGYGRVLNEQVPTLSLIALGGRPDRRHRAAPHPVRAAHVRDRLQRGVGASGRRPRSTGT